MAVVCFLHHEFCEIVRSHVAMRCVLRMHAMVYAGSRDGSEVPSNWDLNMLSGGTHLDNGPYLYHPF